MPSGLRPAANKLTFAGPRPRITRHSPPPAPNNPTFAAPPGVNADSLGPGPNFLTVATRAAPSARIFAHVTLSGLIRNP
jgi:hypothetical protein